MRPARTASTTTTTRTRIATVYVNEHGFAECSDGIDNDGNGHTDCGDYACKPPSGTPSLACQ